MLSRGPICSSLLFVNESLSHETESSMHDLVGQVSVMPIATEHIPFLSVAGV